jgi:hypothetical protein
MYKGKVIMAKYIVNAPNGVQVTISHSYGSTTFRQGEEVFNDKLAVLFPQIFIKAPETIIEKVFVEPVMDAIEVVKEMVAAEPVQTEPVIVTEPEPKLLTEEPKDLAAELAEPPKKKAGRPAGAKNKIKSPKSSVKKTKKA